mmetsp:Transcript_27273/g.93101  ORF Transcript_27273/g.93101 Transcript_27273/m.93101 type:complete len:133 (+) Transcript_27273:37-435(+)
MISCGLAAVGCLVNTIAAKVFVSVSVRAPANLKGGFDPAKAEKEAAGPGAQWTIKAQLNEAEYAGPAIATLLFLESQGASAPLGAALVLGGQVAYFWLVALTRSQLAKPVGASLRYAGLVLLAVALHDAVAR